MRPLLPAPIYRNQQTQRSRRKRRCNSEPTLYERSARAIILLESYQWKPPGFRPKDK